MSRPALACALAAGLLAALAVAGQRIGLALSGALLLLLAAAAPRARPAMLVVAAALAVQPVLLDAGWVVALDVAASLVAGAVAVLRPATWQESRSALLAPLHVVRGSVAVAASMAPLAPRGQGGAIARGTALAAVLLVVFGALFASADTAFAELAESVVDDAGLEDVGWRVVLGVAFVVVGGALAGAQPPTPAAGPGWAPGRLELRIALGALAALFAVFVVVQLRVLFGGAGYVRETTGLGLGEYAREGFVQLLVASGLVLGLVAVAGRRRDRVVHALLAVLCALTLVVLVSAHHRLGLVEDAYGFTRVRYGGHAVVLWLAAVYALVLVRARPAAIVHLTLVAVLAFSLSNPDARIAERAVDRHRERGTLDATYLGSLSADALPAVEELPPGLLRDEVEGALRAGLEEPDGVAGFNLARRRAR